MPKIKVIFLKKLLNAQKGPTEHKPARHKG